MVDIFDMIHYLIGFIILACILFILIQTNKYFSRNNTPLESLINKNKNV